VTRIYHKCGSVVDHEREDPWRHWLRRRFRAVHCAACAEEESQKLIKTWSSWFDTVQVGVREDIQLLRMARALIWILRELQNIAGYVLYQRGLGKTVSGVVTAIASVNGWFIVHCTAGAICRR